MDDQISENVAQIKGLKRRRRSADDFDLRQAILLNSDYKKIGQLYAMPLVSKKFLSLKQQPNQPRPFQCAAANQSPNIIVTD